MNPEDHNQKKIDELERRHNRLEIAVEKGFAETSTAIKSMAGATEGHINRLGAVVEKLADVQQQSSKVPWGVLASWAAVLITIGGLVIGGVVSRSDALRTAQREFFQQQIELRTEYLQNVVLELKAGVRRAEEQCERKGDQAN